MARTTVRPALMTVRPPVGVTSGHVTDPLAPLLELAGVDDAVQSARQAVDAVHRHPTNRKGWPTTAAEASVRAARASAAIDGGDAEIPPDGEVREPVLAGALRAAGRACPGRCRRPWCTGSCWRCGRSARVTA